MTKLFSGMDRSTVRESAIFGERPRHLTLHLTDVCTLLKNMNFSGRTGKSIVGEKPLPPTFPQSVNLERRQNKTDHFCPVECVTKSIIFIVVTAFIMYLPFGDAYGYCQQASCGRKSSFTGSIAYLAQTQSKEQQRNHIAVCSLCDFYKMIAKGFHVTVHTVEMLVYLLLDLLYEAKLMFYSLLEKLDKKDLCGSVCCKDSIDAKDIGKDEVDKVIEDEITQKLSDDLLQSLERKFQVDLQKSVDMVLMKIKLLLKNGTVHIQDRLSELQDTLDIIKSHGEKELEECLLKKQNETSALAEKALHQMVVCGYALIGHDPAQAVHSVLALKNMIHTGIKPIYDQKNEVYGLLKVCGHDHDTLKKVIKCVISKSPIIKSAMMDVTGKLIDGVVSLTKLMAHGAMHEACLIEVIKNIEDEAFALVEEVRVCVYNNNTFMAEINNYIKENNATVLDVTKKPKEKEPEKEGDVKHMKDLIRRMLSDNKAQDIDTTFKTKLMKLQQDLVSVDNNEIVKKDKKDK
ncbi:unnamed protein product [Chrysodeixis includens]|uniref:Uncharacterized protein n=1 Tax=Chrysodeixis includens TaxID=689277 RepID=A0A9P0BM02_CHRIL|nr:unnamed protein product [Chrysodeixis includens]